MRTNKMWMVVFVILALTMVQPALAGDNFINGYFMSGITASKSTNSGYDGIAGSLRLEGETPGRLSVFGSFTGTQTEKFGLGALRQYDYRLAGKYKLTEKFAVGIGIRQSDMQFTDIDGKRKDQAIFIPASYDVNAHLRLNGEFHLPDNSKYKSETLILGYQYFVPAGKRWNLYLGAALDGSRFEVADPSKNEPNRVKSMTGFGARVVFGTGLRRIGYSGLYQAARK